MQTIAGSAVLVAILGASLLALSAVASPVKNAVSGGPTVIQGDDGQVGNHDDGQSGNHDDGQQGNVDDGQAGNHDDGQNGNVDDGQVGP